MSDNSHTFHRSGTGLAAGISLALLALLVLIVGIGGAFGGAWLERIAAREPSPEGKASATRLTHGKSLLPPHQQTD